ncbi:MAG: redox-regulated ATPase YchF [Chloroflexota bacterium]
MSVNIGITGLAKSGKTTIFNALTKGRADTTSHAANIGVARVPEPRLEKLAGIFHPHKITPAEVKYIDIGAAAPGLSREKGIGGQLLGQLANTDALLNVVRAFQDERVPHPEGSLGIERDISAMNLELAFSDMGIIERRLERITESLKGAKPPERQSFLKEQELLLRIKAELEKERPVREMGLSPEEAKALSNYQLLTAKPLLMVVNIREDQLPEASALEVKLRERYARPQCAVLTLCGKVEQELAELDEEAAASFRADFGLKESGLDRVIRESYRLLGLISFFTVVSSELRVWAVPQGAVAVKAAGKIHSDMERGFIRAEVVSYEDLLKCGSLAEARSRGLLRLEGKTYVVKDGDIITFLFNV